MACDSIFGLYDTLKECGYDDLSISAHIALAMISCETEINSNSFMEKAEKYVAERNKDLLEIESL
jgi:uncharacterized protein YlxP (DUF503 family)